MREEEKTKFNTFQKLEDQERVFFKTAILQGMYSDKINKKQIIMKKQK